MQKSTSVGAARLVHSVHGAASKRSEIEKPIDVRRKDRLLRLNEVIDRTGLGKSSVYSDPDLRSKRRRISARLVGWLESDVDRWIAERASAD